MTLSGTPAVLDQDKRSNRSSKTGDASDKASARIHVAAPSMAPLVEPLHPVKALAHIRGLDGLRALAVAAVVLFHLDPKWLPGGFIGVDVFFVLSGFLMVRMIAPELDQDAFDARRFLLRRFRRLAPTLAVVSAATLLGASLVLLPEQLERTWIAAAFANLHVANIFFWQTLDYFSADAALQPFLHTWSLGVEAQFYVALPIVVLTLLWVVPRACRGALLAAVASLMLISLTLAVVAADVRGQTTGAFFVLFTRAWELLAGGMMALLPAFRPRNAIRWMLAAFAVLAGCAILYGEDAALPGMAAIPVVGAVALLVSMARSDLLPRVLSWGPVRGLGQISYSLYLWHWPVIVLGRYAWPEAHPATLTFGILVVTLACSLASYRWVEVGFARPGAPLGLLAGALLVTLVVSAAIGTVRTRMLESGPAAHWLAHTADDAVSRVQGSYDYDGCFRRHTDPSSLPDRCLKAATGGERDILLLGDSHAAHLRPGLLAAFPDAHLRQANVAGCRALVGAFTASGPTCETVTRQALAAPPGDLTVLAGRWSSSDLPALDRTLSHLKTAGHRVALIGKAAEYSDALPALIVRLGGVPDPVRLGSQRVDEDLETHLAHIARRHGVLYLSSRQALCGKGPCRIVTGEGMPVQWDYGHYTQEGSILVVAAMRPALASALAAPR